MRVLTGLAALAVGAMAQGSTSAASSEASSITASAVSASGTASSNSTTSTQSGPVTHTVAVAKGGHTMVPDVTLAEVGDTIEFQFYPTNHSVIRAAYGYPCVPYEMVMGVGNYGFWSGWEPVDAVLDDPPSYSVVVNDTEPIFYYCGAPGSCIGYQMIGVINPNASTSLAHQKQLAGESTFVLVPGEDWPSEGSIPSGVAHTSSATPTQTSAAATVTASSAPSHHGLGAGAIAGIVIGGSAVLLAAGVAIWFCGRQSRKGQMAAPMTPAQQVQHYHDPRVSAMYGKPGHMSTVSGYTMPPQYDPSGMPSYAPTPVDPVMGQQNLTSPGPQSPALNPSSPASHPATVYSPGTHHVQPVEMETGQPVVRRSSTEKPQGVERYS